MSDAIKNMEIEDVLSSIRRLVSDDLPRQTVAAEVADTPGKLVLTPSLRVASDRSDGDAAEPKAAGAPVFRRATDVPPAQTWEEISLEDRIAELEAAVSKSDEVWEPDGSEVKAEQSGVSTLAEELMYDPDAPVEAPLSLEPSVAIDAPESEAERAPEPEPEAIAEPETVVEVEAELEAVAEPEVVVEAETVLEAVTEPEFEPEPEPIVPLGIAAFSSARAGGPVVDDAPVSQPLEIDAVVPEVVEEALLAEDASLVEEAPVVEDAPQPEAEHIDDDQDEDAGSTLFDGNETLIDEEMLSDLIRDIVRKELQGELGERITRNVRKLVRREINRAMVSRDFE